MVIITNLPLSVEHNMEPTLRSRDFTNWIEQVGHSVVIEKARLSSDLWLLPAPTVWTSIGIFTSAYVALAWHDEVYDCKLDRLRHYPGVFNDLTGWLKPDVKPSGTY
jgi:hypothetical protein